MPIGPVIAVNAVPINGANLSKLPSPSISGPIAAAIPPITTIVFCNSGDNDPILLTMSAIPEMIGVIIGNSISPNDVAKFLTST
jgi:hypothetical protein